ncbi:hypothetical protein [Caenispirillum bisanense]|uniref:Uncharacterized protein n=1 Tax=Caenispirillum bisanense TaxID=414052 RepID=A0A286GM88_9PROT|nr:hypothetical protein [Caenispirillum bisanense]SOD96612.1 hypothetical protein SAMN05421508_1063 [Caenispirillum bisanense]
MPTQTGTQVVATHMERALALFLAGEYAAAQAALDEAKDAMQDEADGLWVDNNAATAA